VSERTQSGRVTVGDLPSIFKKLKTFSEIFTEDEIKASLAESYGNMDEEIDFESFLRVSFYFASGKVKGYAPTCSCFS